MRWYDGLLLGCLAVTLFFVLLAVLVVGQVRLEPTPVPFHTFAPHLR